jgi:hypothetical protein
LSASSQAAAHYGVGGRHSDIQQPQLGVAVVDVDDDRASHARGVEADEPEGCDALDIVDVHGYGRRVLPVGAQDYSTSRAKKIHRPRDPSAAGRRTGITGRGEISRTYRT